jgi:hypothetical protein
MMLRPSTGGARARLCERGVHGLRVARGAPGVQALDLLALGRGVDRDDGR